MYTFRFEITRLEKKNKHYRQPVLHEQYLTYPKVSGLFFYGLCVLFFSIVVIFLYYLHLWLNQVPSFDNKVRFDLGAMWKILLGTALGDQTTPCRGFCLLSLLPVNYNTETNGQQQVPAEKLGMGCGVREEGVLPSTLESRGMLTWT